VLTMSLYHSCIDRSLPSHLTGLRADHVRFLFYARLVIEIEILLNLTNNFTDWYRIVKESRND
jgi:hypothetical protein